jgi:hypothetical protein
MATKPKTENIFIALAETEHEGWVLGWSDTAKDAMSNLTSDFSVSSQIRLYQLVCPVSKTAEVTLPVTKIVVK